MTIDSSVPSQPSPTDRAGATATAPGPLPDPATYDPTNLRRFLDGRWADVREEYRETLGELWADTKYGLSTEDHRARTAARFFRLAQFPDLANAFVTVDGKRPEAGRGLTIFEMVAMIDPSLAILLGVQFGLHGGAINNLGTEKHHEKYLPRITFPDGMGCFAMTEEGYGSNVQGLRTTATYDPATGEFIVHTPDVSARKTYIGNAARNGRQAVVFAQLIVGGTNHGVHAVMVPIRDRKGRPMPGVTIEDNGVKGGLNGVDNGRLSFAQVRVPRDALLNRFADVSEDDTYDAAITNPNRRFLTMIGTLVPGRAGVAGAANGASKTTLKIAVNRSLTPRDLAGGEKPPLDLPLHQLRVLVPLARAYAMHFARNDLVDDIHDAVGQQLSDTDQRRLEVRAAAIKVVTTDTARDTVTEMMEVCAGSGFMAENMISGIRGDIGVYPIFEGSNPVLRLHVVTPALLTGYKQAFEQFDSLGRAKFVSQQVLEDIREHTPVRHAIDFVGSVIRRSGEQEALRHERQLDLFGRLEQHLVARLAKRIKAEMKAGATFYEAYTKFQVHAVEVANAHADNLVLQSFVRNIARCEDPATAALLGKVCDLYALATLDRNAKQLMQHGLLNADESKAVMADMERVCAQLRPYAAALVDGFGIPDAWITAPDGQRPSTLETTATRDVSAASTSPVAPRSPLTTARGLADATVLLFRQRSGKGGTSGHAH